MTAPLTNPPPPKMVTAQAWLERGHQYASIGRQPNLLTALTCYDQARAVCTSTTTDSSTLRLLGLAWMNRGNILQQLGHAEDCEAALNAYDAALTAFRTIAAHPGLINTIAATHLNRARAYQRLGDTARAVADYRTALDEFRPLADADDFAARRNASGAALNLAQLLSDDEKADPEVPGLLNQVTTWLAPIASTDSVAATLALEAARLDLVGRETTLTGDTFSAFTDRLESALALAASWFDREHPTARDLAASFFRLGATAYAECQPHFLLEFLREFLDSSTGPAPFAHQPIFLTIASETLDTLRRDLRRPRVFNSDDATSHNIANLCRELDEPLPWLHSDTLSS